MSLNIESATEIVEEYSLSFPAAKLHALYLVAAQPELEILVKSKRSLSHGNSLRHPEDPNNLCGYGWRYGWKDHKSHIKRFESTYPDVIRNRGVLVAAGVMVQDCFQTAGLDPDNLVVPKLYTTYLPKLYPEGQPYRLLDMPVEIS